MAKGGDTTTGTTTVELPEWADKAAQDILRRAQVVSDQPYTRYPHERLAPFNSDQNAAFNLTRMLAPQFGQSASNAMLAGGAPQLVGGLPSLSGITAPQQQAAPAPQGGMPSIQGQTQPGGMGGSAGMLSQLAQMMGESGTRRNGTALSTPQLLEQIFGPGAGSIDETRGFDTFAYGQDHTGEKLFGAPGPLPLWQLSSGGSLGGGSGVGTGSQAPTTTTPRIGRTVPDPMARPWARPWENDDRGG